MVTWQLIELASPAQSVITLRLIASSYPSKPYGRPTDNVCELAKRTSLKINQETIFFIRTRKDKDVLVSKKKLHLILCGRHSLGKRAC